MNVAIATEPHVSADTARRQGVGLYIFILTGVYLLAALWNLNIQTIAHPDEPRYAAAAREMLRSGDWIVPMFNHQPRLVKPIFFYWELAALGAVGRTLGIPMATAFRLGPIFMGLLAVLATFLLGSRWRNPRYGFVAAVILMTTFEFHKLSRELVVDMTLTAFLLWSWLFFHIAIKRLETQAAAFAPFAPLLGFYFCLGMACMTKGPFLVAIFVVVPLLAYLWWTGRLKLLPRSGIFWGAPLSLALGLWWSFAIKARGLDAGSFFSVENIDRFLGDKDHAQNPYPFYFYLKSLCGDFAPWVILLPVAAWWSWKTLIAAGASLKARFGRLSDPARMLACCVAIPFFIMGISISKRPLYLLPIYPFLALWVAWLVDAAFLVHEGQNFCRRCANVLAAGAVVLFGGLAVAAHWLPNLAQWFPKLVPPVRAEKAELLLMSVLFAGLAVVGASAAVHLKAGLNYKALLRILAMAVALIIGYEAVVLPIRERDADRVSFFAAVRERIQNRPFVMNGESSNEAVWYVDRPNEELKNPPVEKLKAEFFEKPGVLMLAVLKKIKLKHDVQIDPKLLSAVRVLGDPIVRGPDKYILAEPDPEHPPDPSVFVAKVSVQPGED